MDEWTRERFDPVPLVPRRKPPEDLEVIAQRRRVLCGTEPNVPAAVERVRGRRLAAARRSTDTRLVRVIRRWKA